MVFKNCKRTWRNVLTILGDFRISRTGFVLTLQVIPQQVKFKRTKLYCFIDLSTHFPIRKFDFNSTFIAIILSAPKKTMWTYTLLLEPSTKSAMACNRPKDIVFFAFEHAAAGRLFSGKPTTTTIARIYYNKCNNRYYYKSYKYYCNWRFDYLIAPPARPIVMSCLF